jgi:copper(I)-binding protein
MWKAAFVIAAALAATSAQAAPRGAPGAAAGVEAEGAWSRPAVAGLNGVGYMTLANHGRTTETLVKVESPLAERVEVHRSQMSGGVMSMSAAPRVAVPAGGRVAFAPGAYHLMFLGLKRTLKPGDRLPAVLVFAGGRRIAVSFAVGTGAPPVGHSDAAG